jgi:S-formylglutathione hydrolase FrmB
MPAELRRLGARAPVVLAVDGGESSYFHDRDSGDWESMIADEVIPAAIRLYDVDPDCIGIAGFSMGGYGAINFGLDHPSRIRLVGLHDAAIWTDAGQSAAGAFDDAEDFDAHDVIEAASSRGHKLRSTWVHVDRGTASPFSAGNDALVAALEDAGVTVHQRRWDGGHSIRSIRPQLRSIMREYAAALDC